MSSVVLDSDDYSYAFTADGQGRITQETYTDNMAVPPTLMRSVDYTYNEDGTEHTETEKQYDSAGVCVRRNVRTYNPDGTWRCVRTA